MKLSTYKATENTPLPAKIPAFIHQDAREAIHLLRFLLSPKGKKILKAMSDEYQTVGEIQVKTGLVQGEVSVALRKLRQFDMVMVESIGKYRYYRLDYNRLSRILDVSSKLAAFYDESEDPEEVDLPGDDSVAIGSFQMQGEEI